MRSLATQPRIADTAIGAGFTDGRLTESQVREIVESALAPLHLAGKKVLLIIPDSTRTAPVGLLFRIIHDLIGSDTAALDVMIALGTHPPMADDAINRRLEITAEERIGKYRRVRVLNHAWNEATALARIGTIPAREIGELSGGLFVMDVDVSINRAVFDYDQLVIVGPVFPHEVVGFSGGNKYLFPGIGGPEILNFFHWLAAVITNPKIIGNKGTPVRRVVDRAAALVPVPRFAFCMVVHDGGLAGLFAGAPEAAWSKAADLSDQLHIVYKDHPFHTVLSCAPPMYDEIWVGGKCMYKLEPVVADGGELIIYAPHIREISETHGAVIRRIGYHTRDYFLAQWERFKHEPWGVLAHSTHVRGVGSYENGVEKPRIRVTLATQIPEAECRAINLGYRDPKSINVADYRDREDHGILYVPKAGEMLYRLNDPPEWARE
ncbi:MAG TPA: lactate racemase domain-containing protein [Gemmataceae bacterium]|nr:lactate racemase domain-containing protein [Gemmataceae bacterium]